MGYIIKDAMRRELWRRLWLWLFRFGDRNESSSSLLSSDLSDPTFAGMQQNAVKCVSRACHEEQSSLKIQRE